MQFGISTPLTNAQVVKEAGWDFVEECIQTFFRGDLPDEQWQKPQPAALPVLAANMLVPGSLKITGPAVDFEKLRQYMSRVVARAAQCGTNMLVFGSGGARNVPDGFDRERARQQIVDFAKMSAQLAAHQGVTLVAEPLNRGECNIINSVPEAMQYVRAVNHPNFQCLVDSYHFWLENDSLDELKKSMPWIKHVHLADKDGRVPPGESGKSDYRPFFRVIKNAGYQGLISVEVGPGAWTDLREQAPGALKFLKQQWSEA